MKTATRIISAATTFSIVFSCVVFAPTAKAGLFDEGGAIDTVYDWLFGAYNDVVANKDISIEVPGSWKFSSSVPQKYYTTPTSSVEDKYGNVTNYYRGGDTTNTQILDSYNKTFNTIHNTTNCQRQSEIVRKRRRNFVVFRREWDNKIKRFLAQIGYSQFAVSGA